MSGNSIDCRRISTNMTAELWRNPLPIQVWRFDTGGAKGSRTPDLLNAIQALSQLSYGPGRAEGGI